MTYEHMVILYYENYPIPDSDGIYAIPWMELSGSINDVKEVLDSKGYTYDDIIFDTDVQVFFMLRDEISDEDLVDIRNACKGVFTVRSMDENRRNRE